jgi:hypothetical protein
MNPAWPRQGSAVRGRAEVYCRTESQIFGHRELRVRFVSLSDVTCGAPTERAECRLLETRPVRLNDRHGGAFVSGVKRGRRTNPLRGRVPAASDALFVLTVSGLNDAFRGQSIEGFFNKEPAHAQPNEHTQDQPVASTPD